MTEKIGILQQRLIEARTEAAQRRRTNPLFVKINNDIHRVRSALNQNKSAEESLNRIVNLINQHAEYTYNLLHDLKYNIQLCVRCAESAFPDSEIYCLKCQGSICFKCQSPTNSELCQICDLQSRIDSLKK